MKDKPTVLVVDDEPGHRQMIKAVMGDEGYDVLEAENGQKCLETLKKKNADVILLDMKMPVMNGMSVLEELQQMKNSLPVIMLTAFGSVGSNAGLKDKIKTLQQQSNIIGQSQAMRHVMELVDQVGPTEANVLILGESGTGKELIAKALHKASLRKDGPMIKVNCAALPEELLESELFGYSKGAFTGAVKDKPGRFQLAEKGTLFLDEIGELPLHLQAKLLRALQERVVEPLGSVREVKVDVRLVAATNKDLLNEVGEGRFRQDLYFRLNVLEIMIPPLRERLDDLPMLVNHFIRVLGEKNRKQVRGVDRSFLDALGNYHWPGNVRELENVVERAIILSRSDILNKSDLPSVFFETESSAEKNQASDTTTIDRTSSSIEDYV
ncbi:MAG: sigma-54 dependent transcriptional regulator, partial [Desulfovibrionales bacterium]|nr:sigma-54 dependent transcriptional regulator [Desulfovibrionales bacterium]